MGNNGVGKTNLLDAIHYLSFCKSYFNAIDSQNIKHNEGFLWYKGFWAFWEDIEVYCGLKRNQKKVLKNKREYERLSEHIGQFPLVMISPNDSELINGVSEIRRRFLDNIISQYDKVYLDKLISYGQVLKQRNALLKHFQEHRSFESETLDVLDEQLVLYGRSVLQIRHSFWRSLFPCLTGTTVLSAIVREIVSLGYLDSMDGRDFKTALLTSLARDFGILDSGAA